MTRPKMDGRTLRVRGLACARWPRPSNQPTVGLPSLLLSHPQRLPPLPSAPQSRPACPPHGLRTRHKRQFNNPQVWQLWARASRARCQLTPRTCHHRQPLPLSPPAPSLPAPPISILQPMQRQPHELHSHLFTVTNRTNQRLLLFTDRDEAAHCAPSTPRL